MALKTEFAFTLPRGFLAADGSVHRRGVMRLATARDEIEPLRDPRVQGADDPFLTIIVLSRVITELGTLQAVTPREIENLFAADLAFLQDLYGVVNFGSPNDIAVFLAEAEAAIEPESASSRSGRNGSAKNGVAKNGTAKKSSKAAPSSKSKKKPVVVEEDEYEDDEDDDMPIMAGRRRGGAVIEEVTKDS